LQLNFDLCILIGIQEFLGDEIWPGITTSRAIFWLEFTINNGKAMSQIITKMSTNSERQAKEFQRKFITQAIELMGSQESLAKKLILTQQSVSAYKSGSNTLSLAKMIRIAKLAGMGEIHVTWA
jgi:hypothetical protein